MKVGYLVRVKDTTHDPELPEDRVGLVARVWEGVTYGTRRRRRGASETDGNILCEVYFPNGAVLDFHIEFLEVLAKS